VRRALREAHGKRAEAARLLGVHERTLYRWLAGQKQHAERKDLRG
jgi:ActR/RegA family two-component response regulator